jgi:hypothetical protein
MTLKEVLISNDERVISLCIELYNDIMSENSFTDNVMKKIDVKKKAICNIFCCSAPEYYVFKNYIWFEDALYDLLETYGCSDYYRNETKWDIEFIFGKSTGDTVDNDFAIHQDYGEKTIILYLYTNCKGGELKFYEKTHCSYENVKTIDINSESLNETKGVIFNSNLYHKPESFTDGERCAIVCQLMSI